ncbi:Ferric iron ABC transporter, ATP-binding protein [Thioalkalivibrio nitratireducens DSM 14787]|uniref:Ferric iron ABC transporter, ATP-binding protein n=1 Tax=Thioalkalivibrio nitratireducens (strain DSM 14787 / UNIQEM 213 / ALEN2) TaxID=1255043 RepID=L0DV11_THIND|nr:Ferric iron ABC transporter, ATP-binding protein [Thioalkalivibrio nitratireducens DSM 14787]
MLDDIDVGYSGQRVVHAISLELSRGQIGCLLGPSGCGKTTLLRAIAGFEGVMRGEIRLNDETVSRPGFTLAPEKRNVGMVFQDFALFPHLDVTGNIAFGIRRWSRTDREHRVKELLRLIGLSGYEHAFPHALSGGQQQRIALARALAPRPQLLLLDEPFSSMDVELRTDLAREVRAILRAEGTTGILVTHDQHEAFAFADRIAVLNNGRLCQWDTAYHLYHKPADRFVAGFVGEGTIIPGRVCAEDCVETALGRITGGLSDRYAQGAAVDVLVRPDDITVDNEAGTVPAEVTAKAFRGADFLYTLRLQDGTEVLCVAPSHDNFIVSDHVRVRLDFSHLVAFPRGESGCTPH